MEQTLRPPFTGVWNIIRFNWHFYLLAIGVLLLLFFGSFYFQEPFNLFFTLTAFLVFITTLVSLLVSFWVYDISDLYRLKWLDDLAIKTSGTILNVNAGFDETSVLLAAKYPDARLIVCDFYNPEMHTEISIKRARKAFPPYPGTKRVSTTQLPFADGSVDHIFAILSAHEIRDDDERIEFFKELKRLLKPKGNIIVTEHLRDIPNFAAYNIGFLHFLSKNSWLKTFRYTGMQLEKELKITPFITSFILNSNGGSS